MIKPLPFANGYLSKRLGQYDLTAKVDTWLYNYLAANLYNEYSYLKIYDGCSTEVVKIINTNNGLLYLERAQEYTNACSFGINTAVEYCLTVAEIKQYANIAPLYVWPVWPIKLDGNGFSCEDIKFTTKGSSEVVINGNIITIAHDFGAYGCCDCQPLFAAIGNKDYYLTSRPYPVDITETMQATASIEEIRTRLQPYGVGSIYSTAHIEDISIYGSAKSFKAPVDWMQVYTQLEDVSIYGSAKSFKAPVDWMQVYTQLEDVSIYGSGVSYTVPPNWVKTTVELSEIKIYV